MVRRDDPKEAEWGFHGREKRKEEVGGDGLAYSAHDGVMGGEVCLAGLATEDAVGVEVGVVDETHCVGMESL